MQIYPKTTSDRISGSPDKGFTLEFDVIDNGSGKVIAKLATVVVTPTVPNLQNAVLTAMGEWAATLEGNDPLATIRQYVDRMTDEDWQKLGI